MTSQPAMLKKSQPDLLSPVWQANIAESHVEVRRNGIKQITDIAVFCQIHLIQDSLREWLWKKMFITIHHWDIKRCQDCTGRLERWLSCVFFRSWKSLEVLHWCIESCHYVIMSLCTVPGFSLLQTSLEYLAKTSYEYLNVPPKWKCVNLVPSAIRVAQVTTMNPSHIWALSHPLFQGQRNPYYFPGTLGRSDLRSPWLTITRFPSQ